MSTHNIPFSIKKTPKLCLISSDGVIFKGFENESKIVAVVIEPSVFD